MAFCAANKSVSMQAVFPIDALTPVFPLPADTTSNQALAAGDLQALGDRLRVTYGPVEATLPVRLAELVERLARREQTNDQV